MAWFVHIWPKVGLKQLSHHLTVSVLGLIYKNIKGTLLEHNKFAPIPLLPQKHWEHHREWHISTETKYEKLSADTLFTCNWKQHGVPSDKGTTVKSIN